jgi:hypothetical protein
LLILFVIVFILQHDRIEKWFLERTRSFGIQLETGNDQTDPIATSFPAQIPEYSGKLSIELNNNIPSFSDYDLTHITGESYSGLDSLGRCGGAAAMLDRSMMPKKRGKRSE